MVEQLEVEVRRYSSPGTILNFVPRAVDVQVVTELVGVGAGSFRIAISDPSLVETPNLLDYRNLVVVRDANGVVGSFIIQKKEEIVVGSGEESAKFYQVSGEGPKSWFHDAVVYSETGLRESSYDDRYFNFASINKTGWYSQYAWTDAVVQSSQGNQDYSTNPWKNGPAEWPDDPSSQWIWVNTGVAADKPKGDAYFRKEFTISTAGAYSIFFSGDDEVDLFVDGALVASTVGAGTTWWNTTRVDIDFDTGSHVIASRVRNLIPNQASFICSLWRVGDPNVPSSASKILNTDASWKALGYPSAPPAWTAGEIMIALLNEAKVRGVQFPNNLSLDFNGTIDSNGDSWDRDLDWTFSVGTEYAEVIERMEEMGFYFEIDPSAQVFSMYKNRGQDTTLTNTAVVLEEGKNITSAKNSGQSNIKSTLAIKTADGWVERSYVDLEYGRIEGQLSTSVSASSVDKVSWAVFGKTAFPETSADIEFLPVPGAVPFKDFRVGDWIFAPDGRNIVKRRVVSLAVTQSDSGPVYSAEFDTIIKDKIDKLERRITNLNDGKVAGIPLANGSSGKGSTKGQPIISRPDGAQPYAPLAPTGITTSSQAFFDALGNPYTDVTIDWNAVTADEKGFPVNPAGYEIWQRRQGEPTTKRVRVSQTSSTIATLSQYQPGSVWLFNLRTVSPRGGYLSAFTSDITVTMAVSSTPPPKPSPPILTTRLGSIIATWDGKVMNPGAVNAPPFISYVYAKASTTSAGVYAPVGASLDAAGDIVMSNLTVGQEYFIKFYAVDKTGVESVASDTVSIVVEGIEEIDIPQAIIDQIDDAADAASDAANAAAAAQEAAATAQEAADNLLAQSPDLIRNGSFENTPTLDDSAAAWWTKTGTPTLSTSVFKTGKQALQLVYNATTRSVYSPSFEFTRGDKYRLSFWVNTSGTPSGGFRLSDPSTLTTILQITTSWPNTNSLWQKQTVDFTIPAGSGTTVSAVLRILMSSAGGAVYVDDVSLQNITEISSAIAKADQALTDAYNASVAAGQAQSTANGKNRTWYQTSAPTGSSHSVNDIWYDTDDGNKLYRWDGSTWIAATFGGSAISDLAINDAKLADNAVTINKIGNLAVDSTKLADNAVSTAKLADSAVNVNKIADNAVQAGKIASSAVTYVKLATDVTTPITNAATAAATAQATADTLIAQLPEMVVNGGFEQNLLGWTATDAGVPSVSTTSPHTGLRRLTLPGSVVAGIKTVNFSKPSGEVRTYRVSFWASVNNTAVAVTSQFRDASNDTAITGASLSNTYPTAGSWYRKSYDWTVPAGITDFYLRLARSASSGSSAFIDDVSITDITEIKTALDTAAAAQATATAAQTAAGNAQTSANGKNKIFYLPSTTPPSGTLVAGDTWFKTDQGNSIFRYDGANWNSAVPLGSSAISDNAITTAKLDSAVQNAITTAQSTAESAITAANGKNTITWSASDPSGTGTNGDVWYKRAAGQGIAGIWEWVTAGGAGWTPRPLRNEVLESITADKINAGTISADRIGANSISSAKLLISDLSNLIDDPDMQTPLGVAWQVATGSSAEWDIQGSSTPFVDRYVRHQAGSGGTDATSVINTYRLPVRQGERYVLTGQMYHTGSGAFTAGVQYYTNTGSASGRDTQSQTTTGTWAPFVFDIEIPADAYYMSVRLATTGVANTIVRWSNLLLRRKAGAALIVDGAITADKLSTNAVTTDKLSANAVTAAKIATNTITANEIATGTLTSASGVFGTVDASILTAGTIASARIGAGSIDATKLAANTITADKLAIGDGYNFAGDSGFELGGYGLTLTGAFSIGTAQAHSGTSSAVTTGAAGKIFYNNPIDVVPGDKIYVSAWTLKNATFNNTAFLRLGSDAAGVGTTLLSVTAVPSANVVWQQFSGVYTVAAGITRVWLSIETTNTGGNFYVDDVVFAKQTPGVYIQDGAITAAKITAGSITSAEIAAGTIVSRNIATNSISATNLTLSDFTNLLDNPIPDSAYIGNIGLSSTPTVPGWNRNTGNTGSAAIATTSSQGNGFYLYGGQNVEIRVDNLNVFPVNDARGLNGSDQLWIFLRAYNTLTVPLRVVAVTYDESGSLLSSANILTVPASTPTWTDYDATYTLPSTVRRVRITYRVSSNSDSSSQFAAFIRPIVRRKASANLIVDGAITTDKLVANAVTTAKIATNAVTANEIAAGTITATEIAGGTITAAKLTAGTLTSASGVFGDISAANIQSGTLDAARIAANSITGIKLAAGSISTDKITVGDFTNLIDDPEFQNAANTWIEVNQAGRQSVTYTTGLPGPTWTINPLLGTAIEVRNANIFNVVEGESLYVGLRTRNSMGTTAAVRIVWYGEYASNGSRVETIPAAVFSIPDAGSTWNTVTGTVVVPAGARYGQFMLRTNTNAATSTTTNLWFGQPFVRKQVGTTLITPNSITTALIQANAVTANEIAAGTITSNNIATGTIESVKIAASAITATKIAAGAITADKLSVGTFNPTGTSSNRVAAGLTESVFWGNIISSQYDLGPGTVAVKARWASSSSSGITLTPSSASEGILYLSNLTPVPESGKVRLAWTTNSGTVGATSASGLTIHAFDYNSSANAMMAAPSASGGIVTIPSAYTHYAVVIRQAANLGAVRYNYAAAFEVIGDGNAATVEISPSGVLAKRSATGQRAELTAEGLRLTDDSAGSYRDLVRIGYGIDTGMAIRKPGTTNEAGMVPLAKAAFGAKTVIGSGTPGVTLTGPNQDKGWASWDSLESMILDLDSWSSQIVVYFGATMFTPGDTGSQSYRVGVRLLYTVYGVPGEPVIGGSEIKSWIGTGTLGDYYEPQARMTNMVPINGVPTTGTIRLRLQYYLRNGATGYPNAVGIGDRFITAVPV